MYYSLIYKRQQAMNFPDRIELLIIVVIVNDAQMIHQPR